MRFKRKLNDVKRVTSEYGDVLEKKKQIKKLKYEVDRLNGRYQALLEESGLLDDDEENDEITKEKIEKKNRRIK